jgi:hypothetical protein
VLVDIVSPGRGADLWRGAALLRLAARAFDEVGQTKPDTAADPNYRQMSAPMRLADRALGHVEYASRFARSEQSVARTGARYCIHNHLTDHPAQLGALCFVTHC